MNQFKYFCLLDGLTSGANDENLGSDQAELQCISTIILNLEQRKVSNQPYIEINLKSMVFKIIDYSEHIETTSLNQAFFLHSFINEVIFKIFLIFLMIDLKFNKKN